MEKEKWVIPTKEEVILYLRKVRERKHQREEELRPMLEAMEAELRYKKHSEIAEASVL